MLGEVVTGQIYVLPTARIIILALEVVTGQIDVG